MDPEPIHKCRETAKEKATIINCHTHIFTGDHVPPFLARTFVPAPFYFFLPLSMFVHFFRWWYKGPATVPYKAWYKKLSERYTGFQALLNRLGFVRNILEYYVALQAFFILYDWVKVVFPPEKTWISGWINDAGDWLSTKRLLWAIPSVWLNLLIVALVFIFLPSGRNLLLFIFKNLWAVMKKMPGKETKEMFKRYLNIGRYAFHKDQGTILGQLKGQYPNSSGLVVLPMDMEYMGAGKTKTRYRDQMEKLAALKNKKTNEKTLFPFVFVDPRRIVKEERVKPGEKIFFDYTAEEGKVKLKEECFIHEYIINKEFSGLKIYPALGYYPFDENLLPLWKYAADNGIPVMTHCVRGPMFYRGKKEEQWNHHPFFEQAMGKDDKRTDEIYQDPDNEDGAATNEIHDEKTIYEPLALPQRRNSVFSANFTHPMNFLCLLEKELLCKVVAKAYKDTGDERLKTIFGYEEGSAGKPGTIKYDLGHLKICLGHYGGGNEWARYLEKDRYGFSNQLTKNPKGIRFLKKENDEPSKGKIEQLWKYTDWYSIISSMILQHPHVYADISYILHDDAAILPLLKQTLQNPVLRKRVLYGTDFYVVRNHKSDKNMLADMMGGLRVEDFDVIARENPRKFLNLPDA